MLFELGQFTMSNYYLDLIEDAEGTLIEVDYYHRGCAPEAVKARGGWPAPSWPDHDVYCAGCEVLIHKSTKEVP